MRDCPDRRQLSLVLGEIRHHQQQRSLRRESQFSPDCSLVLRMEAAGIDGIAHHDDLRVP
jgi:hypothetical protein